jgi:hypothetical protein
MRRNARAAISRWTTPAWRAVLAGILLGAATGALTFDASNANEATAMIRIYQPIDPNQIMTGANSTPDDLQDYISGEITYLGSAGFAASVAKQLNETTPAHITATQDVQSTLITLSSAQAEAPESLRTVDAALTVYGNHLLQQAHERGQAAMDALDKVIAPLEQANPAGDSDGARGVNSGTDFANGAAPDDVQTRLQQLKAQRLAIEVQTARSASVQVVSAPAIAPVKGAPDWSLGAAGGGVLGGVLSLAAVLAWRRRIGLITSVPALETQIEHVLLPTVRLGTLDDSSDEYEQLARSLYAQLPAPRRGTILLVGASVDSGTDEVADLIAFAAAEHSVVRVVHLLSGIPFEPIVSPEDLTSEFTSIIDGGSIDSCPSVPEAAAFASQIVIVAMLGRDVSDTVRMARQLARDSNAQISAVATKLSTGSSRRRGRRAKPTRRHRHQARYDASVGID